MAHILRSLLIISAIIPATVYIILGIWFVVLFLSEPEYHLYPILLTAATLLGLVGYIGLWRNLIYFNKSCRKNNTLLSIGITALLMVVGIIIYEQLINDSMTKKELAYMLALFWPAIVAIIIIIHNSNIHNQRSD